MMTPSLSRVLLTGVLVASVAAITPASARPASTASCSSGAHTLEAPGSRLYPETGNGGYRSEHTLVHLVYDAIGNRFLPGNGVVLTDRATQCLSDFSLDFERHSPARHGGPDLSVGAVLVNGEPARFAFVQPTYPGDPHGQDDPDPAAHEASQTDPVGGPQHNPLPPACTPELLSDDSSAKNAKNGTQCPANKLVITPAEPIADGAQFTVSVSYTGRPGVHNDGDGGREGWYRSGSGGFVITEPIGSEDWMPLNNHPTAKPTYDFVDRVTAGRTVIANGILQSVRHNAPDRRFKDGSSTWTWHAPEPISSYLVENSVGRIALSARTAADGRTYYVAQDDAIGPAQARKNLKIMNKQQDITAFESRFTGPFPFSSDGVFVGTPYVDDQMEMETMIVFDHRRIDLDTLYHENMHQWWGDNVGEGSYSMTFFKEGMATVAEKLFAARRAENAAGGPGTARGRAAFEASLVQQFDATYGKGEPFWNNAPSNPDAYGLFNDNSTYQRPGAAYLALREILGAGRFTQALEDIQQTYGGRTITESEEEAMFAHWLPVQTSGCRSRLTEFFRQWFDTPYPAGHGKPRITGPGLDGPGFYRPGSGCTR